MSFSSWEGNSDNYPIFCFCHWWLFLAVEAKRRKQRRKSLITLPLAQVLHRCSFIHCCGITSPFHPVRSPTRTAHGTLAMLAGKATPDFLEHSRAVPLTVWSSVLPRPGALSVRGRLCPSSRAAGGPSPGRAGAAKRVQLRRGGAGSPRAGDSPPVTEPCDSPPVTCPGAGRLK